MKTQFASFLLPSRVGSEEQEDLNRFLRGHRTIQTWKEFVPAPCGPAWSILVEYAEDARTEMASKSQGQPRIDYKEILSPEDFKVFIALRDLRKKSAEAEGLPVYALFTNDQLAAMAKARPVDITAFKEIDGIGQGKAEKYGTAFISKITEMKGDKDGIPF